ncbi:collagen-like protein [Echinicola marina]|uniref:collagen-like protein n=1 Tax=Echinicola marina TaxID=2859768 RepID=UPI001CF61A34|nr:collagen-like protein [Echinicola marina]UCS93846.1 collagen-like protein [Echinicola marina]
MKTKYYSLLGALCLMIVVSSCIEGEQGPEGPQGEKGEQGEQGIPGVDGNSLLYGNQPPEPSDGKEGDFYIDTHSSELYGPKTAFGWGDPTGLQGEPGKDGEDGSRIYSGSMSPSLNIGELGDFYFQTTIGVLYGPKRSTGWGSGVSLKGPQGEPGTANVIASNWTAYNVDGLSPTKAVVYAYLPSATRNLLLSVTGASSLHDFVNNENGILLVYHRNPVDGLFSLPSFRPMGTWDIKSSLYWTLDGTSGWQNRIIIEVDNMSGGEYPFSSKSLVFGTDRPEFRFVMVPQGALNATVRSRINSDLSELTYKDVINLFGLGD